MALCEEMIQFRADNDLTQQQAAGMAKITLMTWGNVERGLQKPSRVTEAKIRNVIKGRRTNESVDQPD